MPEPVGIVGVATALAKPLEKLVDVCAAGANQVFEPHAIRRRARAEADAALIRAEAVVRGNELALKAAHRLLDIEERRQKNIEAVAEKAKAALPLTVSTEPVDPDWAVRFFNHAQDVGNEHMQLLWAKLLAGEVAKPGSFSPRTLRVVSDLTSREADLFETLCSIRTNVEGERSPVLFYWTSPPHSLPSLDWEAIQELDAAGLVHDHFAGFQLEPTQGPVVIEAAGGMAFRLAPAVPGVAVSLMLGQVSFTPAGAELSQLARWLWNPEHMRAVVEQWKEQGWTVQAMEVSAGALGERSLFEREMPF